MTDKPITFTDECGNALALGIYHLGAWKKIRDATPDDLALAGYEPTTQALDRLAIEAAIVAEDTRSELAALRALEQHIRSELTDDPRLIPVLELLKAVDEARK